MRAPNLEPQRLLLGGGSDLNDEGVDLLLRR
jgi:hypothetical protein